MKRFDCFLKVLCLALFVFLTTQGKADTLHKDEENTDLVDISLLTCSPGSEVWSLYGHTALRINNKANGEDIVVNYGMFSFSQPNFVLRFVFGRTDYQMGIQSFESFVRIYGYEGRGVNEQVLNLTHDEKMRIRQAVAENYRPQNREYRYNFFYDNCTTRARDMLVGQLDGMVDYKSIDSLDTSYRKETHQYNTNHPWARFGNDLLLGVKADGNLTAEQRQFLPDNLERDFARAVVRDANGGSRQLVKDYHQLLLPQTEQTEQDAWDAITPNRLFAVLFFLIVVSSIVEYRRRRMFWPIDMVLFGLSGLAGLILFAMIFSEHPTVSLNLQIFLLNPLFLYGLRPKVLTKQDKHAILFRLMVMISLGIAIISQFFQTFADGMADLALILLVRIIANQRINESTKK